jgi:sortase A
MSTLSKIRQRELARMTPHRGRRAVLGYLASVLMLSGVLLLVDVVITVLWQEPISAALAIRDQDRLDQELQGATGRISRVREDVPSRSTRAELSLLANRYARGVRRGSLIGRISMPSIGSAYVALQGADPRTLRRGPGHYSDTSLPGQGGTVGFAGHRTTFLAPFRRIDELRQGHEIVVSMPYGRFLYRVTRRRIVNPRAVWVINRSAQERLVLTACHPPFSAAKRIVVFADLQSVRRSS